MKHKKEWSLVLHVETELEGIFFGAYLEKHGFHPIFYYPSLHQRGEGGKIFVLQEEKREVQELLSSLQRINHKKRVIQNQ